mmetsp:Transcript_74749/g.178379  ORF Transcript_74749/g.178379 Transcript_74749/m.178379 type:complete len:317 (+) Transcript_74749:70-1020(+)|eukprot:CAMPEP_0181464476 /NCGR_PEP_ID=MMETSP1110-20121109/35453_1 /TAXON_ID=174948 /ORGANISM="Symbiodinium sp., Strain CCMP421" /LENGTH=316 /DNA_ID=CAMNT_0023589213 /DNA_START=70 /DNA_END=1020 /DNA_ORIENTATION=-
MVKLWHLVLCSLALIFRSDASWFRPADTTAWLLWNHPTAIFDPPYCASSTALMINDLVFCAQQVVAMTGDCMGDLESPPDCAADIATFMAFLIDAAQAAAALAMACAGEITTCEQVTTDAAECFSWLAGDLIGAASNCDIDAFLCVLNTVDAVKQIFGAATDIQSAVQTCPTDGPYKAYLKSVGKWPSWLRRLVDHDKDDKSGSGSPQLSPMYRAIVGQSAHTFQKGEGATGRMGVVEESPSGPIMAVDAPGIVRYGSAWAMPNANSLILSRDNKRRLQSLEVFELPTLQEVDIDVYYFAGAPVGQKDHSHTTAYE